jgi:hypothetical protein
MTDRAYAIDFLARATNGTKGVSRGDAPYERITEGRHTEAVRIKRFYSACGDLAQALLFAAGIRDKRFINRAENGTASGDPYKVGWNVVELDALALALRDFKARPVTEADIAALQPGDITIVWNLPSTEDAHVAVVRKPLASTVTVPVLATADYGQGGVPSDGKECLREVSGLYIGKRKLQRIIPLAAALERFRVAEPIPIDEYFAPERMHRRTLRKGDKGGDVTQLQALLNAMRPPLKLLLDGDFGPKTAAAVRDFQSAYSLTVDGIVGPKTWAALED